MRRLAPFIVLLCASGCATGVAESRPTARAWGAGRQGQEMAVYELNGPDGRAGKARVWTGGIHKERGSLVADVGIELENTGALPLAIEVRTLRLSGVVAGDEVIDDVEPVGTAGTPEVGPSSVGGLRVLFELPGDLSPADITEFRLEWAVRIGGDVYAQFTPFVRDEGAEPGYAFVPPAYPSPGAEWGLGWGWGFWGWPGYYPYWTRTHHGHHEAPGARQPTIAALPTSGRPPRPRGDSGGPPPPRILPRRPPGSSLPLLPGTSGPAGIHPGVPPVIRPPAVAMPPPRVAPPAAPPRSAPAPAPAARAEARGDHEGTHTR